MRTLRTALIPTPMRMPFALDEHVLFEMTTFSQMRDLFFSRSGLPRKAKQSSPVSMSHPVATTLRHESMSNPSVFA